MTCGPPVLPLAGAAEPVCYVLVDDEPRYRQAIDVPDGLDVTLAGAEMPRRRSGGGRGGRWASSRSALPWLTRRWGRCVRSGPW